MSPKLSRIIYTTITCIIVFILLISNLGNNFKTDVISYNDIINNINNIKSNWLSSFTNEEYNKITSQYLTSKLESYSIEPIEVNGEKSYNHSFINNLPVEETKSYLEVLSKHDNVMKRFEHGKDFIEDVSGLYSSKYVKGYAEALTDMEFKDSIPSILLLENYNSLSSYNKQDFDEKLKALGVLAVIFKDSDEKIADENGFHDSEYTPTSKGVLKFAVSENAFIQLNDYVNKGYKLKLKSGLKIKEQTLTNVYGKIQGSSKNYKPLIIASFYDGIMPSKFKENKGKEFESNTYTPSILLECARLIKSQENVQPNRTIIFAFLSGKSIDNKGLDVFRELNIDGDLVLLDDFGNSNKFNLSVHEDSKNFSNTINHFMKKNDLKIVSNATNGYIPEKSAYIFGSNNNETGLQFNSSYNTCKFILSLIDDECFNLHLITANSREIRSIKRFLKDYTVPIAAVTLVFITYIVFRYPEIKNSN